MVRSEMTLDGGLRTLDVAGRLQPQCKNPAVRGWRVCRMHGAGGGHRAGKEHPSWRHGVRAREWIETRREINDLVREAREIERMLTGYGRMRNGPTNEKAPPV